MPKRDDGHAISAGPRVIGQDRRRATGGLDPGNHRAGPCLLTGGGSEPLGKFDYDIAGAAEEHELAVMEHHGRVAELDACADKALDCRVEIVDAEADVIEPGSRQLAGAGVVCDLWGDVP
jgi:hypothetical protein